MTVLSCPRAENVNVNVIFPFPQLSPYGFQMIFAPPLQQTPANQPPNSLVLPAETPSGVAPSGNALNAPPQPIQQQQVSL